MLVEKGYPTDSTQLLYKYSHLYLPSYLPSPLPMCSAKLSFSMIPHIILSFSPPSIRHFPYTIAHSVVPVLSKHAVYINT